MSEMKRPVLEYANLPAGKRFNDLSPEEQIICGIAWIADNEGHGVKEAAKRLIDEFRDFADARSARPEALTNVGCETHTNVKAEHCPVCLINERDALRAFYEAVKGCMDDTVECRCGHSDTWWKDSNADYLSKDAQKALLVMSPQATKP